MTDILDKIKSSVTVTPEKKEVKKVDVPKKRLNLFDEAKFLGAQRAKLIRDLKNNKVRNYFRASELGDCAIQLYFRLKNEAPDIQRAGKNHYLPMMAHVGNAIHDFLQGNYNFSHVEHSVNSENYHIHARVDGVIDSNIVVEIKSLGDCRVLRHKDLMQLGANYLLLKEAGFDIQAGQLVYVERTLTKMLAHNFVKAELDHYANEVIQKTKYVMDCIIQNAVPDKFLNTKNCLWCEYHHKCPKKLKNK